jgi:class 3 adenylate cyclase
MKLSTKLLSIYIIIALVAIPVVGYLTYRGIKVEVGNTIQGNIIAQMEQVDEVLTQFLQSIEDDLNTLADDRRVRIGDDRNFTNFLNADEESFKYNIGNQEQAIIDLFLNYKKNHSYANSIYMGRENGSFVRSHKRARPTRYDPRERPWYRLALSQPGTVMRTAPYKSVTTDDINIGTVRTLVDDNDNVYGVIGIDVTVKGLTDYVSRLKIGKKGYILLLDEQYTIMTQAFQPYIDEFFRSRNNIFERGDQRVVITRLEDQYLFYSRSPYSGWIICTVLPEIEISDKVERAIYFSIFWIFAVLFLVSLLTAIGIRRFIVRPTQVLEHSINSIVSTEDMSQDIPMKGNDEIGRLARSFQTMMGRLRDSFKERMKLEKANTHLQRYFSPSIAKEIVQTESDLLRPGGRLQEVVILFSDIRDFTSISESITPDNVMALLSHYHQTLVDIIFRYGGTLDKFIGDALMATFGTPESHEDDIERAVQAAVEMRDASSRIQAELQGITDHPFKYGIGLHTGKVIVGNIGTKDRLEFTVIGDPVNVASRIESACKELDESLLISEAVHERIKDRFKTRLIGDVELKGKTDKVRLYTVI